MKTSALRLALVALAVFGFAAHGVSQQTSPILVKKFSFPWPVEWKRIDNIDVSLNALAWGPAHSPGMVSRGKPLNKYSRSTPHFFPDRPYALALHLQAKSPMPAAGVYVPSNLFRVRDVEGNLEAPMVLTPHGFVREGPAELHFDNKNVAAAWEFFPVSPTEKQFLFQVFSRAGPFSGSAGQAVFSFKVVLTDGTLTVINATPGAQSACLHFAARKFTGTIGADIRVNIQLTREGTRLTGTEQYLRVGKTLWLKGAADYNDNFRLRESYPENHVTGIFVGEFTQRCQTMAGYFSKPDGSQLQPFEFHVAETR